MVFYPDVNVGSTPSYYNYQIVNDYLNSTIATKQENYLEPVAEFSYTGEVGRVMTTKLIFPLHLICVKRLYTDVEICVCTS